MRQRYENIFVYANFVVLLQPILRQGMQKKIKPYVLPTAIVLGICFHKWLSLVGGITPVLIFIILVLTFCSVRLTTLRPSWLEACIGAFQVVFSIAGYWMTRTLSGNDILAEGVLIGILCPVAASVSVVACELGAKRETVVSYTVVGNLLVAIVAPAVFSVVGTQQAMSFWLSFWLILRKIATVLALPYLIALLLQWFLPKVNNAIARYKGAAFYLWATALLLTLGKTMDYIVLQGAGNETTIIWLAVISLILCATQFAVGKLLGHHFGDTIAGGQLLAQKNSAIGIWMACLYLHPLTSVVLAFYSIWTNLFNSWQLWYYARKGER